MDLSNVKGLKEKRLSSLSGEGIFTRLDLLNYLPVKYLDMTSFTSVADFTDGAEVLFRAKTLGDAKNLYFSRVVTTKVIVECEGKKINALWFNQRYMAANLVKDCEYVFFGKLKITDKSVSVLSPMFEKADNAKRLFGIVTKYKKIENVPSSVISKAVKEILDKDDVKSVIPDDIAEKYNLLSLKEGYFAAHFPNSIFNAAKGIERVITEKAVCSMLSVRNKKAQKTRVYKKMNVCEVLQSALSFTLSDSQIKAVKEIVSDMDKGVAMNRLLQGDVGSGKTVVTAAACIYAAKSGYQAAFMAPTTTLIAQHYKVVGDILSRLGITYDVVTANADQETLRKIASGETKVVFGAHSLISKKVEFNNLALCVIDEQQKFGVKARSALAEKGEQTDVITSTATPIPRSLALIIYGELSVSYLENNSLKDIETYIIGKNKVKNCYEFIEKLLNNGGAAYFVCSKIFDDEKTETFGAEEKYKEIKKYYANYRVNLLHGKEPKEERERVTADFLEGKTDILVATSVVEVGVDNPKANAIVIFGAENFGLSSLHQLRGRVGRKGQKSYCFLVTERVNDLQRERLKFFKENLNGFEIADYDLRSRGSGSIYGFNQHGKEYLSAFSGASAEIIKRSKEIAEEIALNYDLKDLTGYNSDVDAQDGIALN